MKFVPLTFSVKPGLPAAAVAGLSEVRVGAGFVMAAESELELPPPWPGLNTVTIAVPAFATSPTGIAAVNWVLLTSVVGRPIPFHRIYDPVMKFEPLTVSVKAEPDGI